MTSLSPRAAKVIWPKQQGCGDVENAARFPHPHTPDDYYGKMSDEALHQHSTWYKRSVRSLRSPGTQKLYGGAVHRWSQGNQAGIRLLFQVGDGVRNGGKRASAMR